MQERNAEKMISLSVRATKMSANVLKSAIRRFLASQKNKAPKVYKGRQSVQKLTKSGEKLTNIEVTAQNISTGKSINGRSQIITTLNGDNNLLLEINYKAKKAAAPFTIRQPLLLCFKR